MDEKTGLRSIWVEATATTTKNDPLKRSVLNGSSSRDIAFHEVGLVLSFKFCWWNELIDVSGGLFVDAMMDDVPFKLLPIVQVHDATE